MRKRFLYAAIGLSLLIAFSLAGCDVLMGKDGAISGEYSYASGSSFLHFYLGGFPGGTIYTNSPYSIQPGTYNVYYEIYYTDNMYYPGDAYGNGTPTDTNLWWGATYTVTANKGSLLQDGTDKSFALYLNRNYGLQVVSGDASIDTSFTYDIVKPVPAGKDIGPGSSSWTSKDGSITVTVSPSTIVALSPEQISALAAQSAR